LFAKRGNPLYGPSSRRGSAADICASKHAINKRRRFFTGIIVLHQYAANVALVSVRVQSLDSIRRSIEKLLSHRKRALSAD